MPTISVDKAELYKALGKEYTTKEFDELCFDFGIELDEDTSEHERPIVNGKQEPAQLKIEIPANRYDMLCFEGIALMLNIFLGRKESPLYKAVPPSSGPLTLTCHESTAKVRPFVAGAILRNIKFTKERYDSFISLQDKLHQNLARQRTLVAIGTHDLDTIKAPFTYEALPPDEIKFVALNQTKERTGREMMEFYKSDKHLSRYLHIIKDAPVYPVILDANRTVCSMPPIINSEQTKIKVTTKNVFIDLTATDRTKLEIVNKIMVCMFSQYTAEPFTVEPIEIVSKHNNESRVVPDLSPREAKASLSYLNACCGTSHSAEKVSSLLKRMSLTASPTSESDILSVQIPPTRADILHKADIMEDLAIAIGFNNLPIAFPKVSATIGQPLAINKLSDILRVEAAMAGWSEVMPLILCSHDENFGYLNRQDKGKTAVRLANPKTAEYQVARTTLLPGLLKTLRENKHHTLPIKIFEAADVVFQDLSLERKARNERHFGAAFCGKSSGFEVVHGLLDRLMLMLKSAFITSEEGLGGKKGAGESSYWISELDSPTFFEGHAANVHLRIGGKESVIGQFGILHPSVLEKFELRYPVSVLEFNLEPLL